MKKKAIIVAVIFIIATAGVAFNAIFQGGTNEEENKVEVRVEGTSIIYDGPMADEGVKKVKELYTKDISRLVLNSAGGEINIGMDLADFVYEKGLDVEIKSIAFSSAANYVFTAGKYKYLHKDSMVGWHGGVTQDNSKNFFMNLFMQKYLKEGKERETKFFEKIGVDQQSTVYGLRPEFDKFTEKDGYVGWTYSLKAMDQLGIKNIVLLDNDWTPAPEYNGKKIFTIDEIQK